jgi:hypothetical protein
MANKKVSFSNEVLTIKEIQDYYARSEHALREFCLNNRQYFIGYTLSEIEEELDKYIQELDKSCSFTLLAAIEAYLRIDYLQRCYNKEKDVLSRDLRALFKIKNSRASLDDDILTLWKKHLSSSCSISELRGALHYRDWLAHGRYWVAKLGRNYDFFELLKLAIFLQNELDIEMGV